ncbi:hypothetical protein N4G69_15680 [Streptomyces mirabilis]|uniref:hypothetical protein n=1 Tax=Streptomyces mirabilis TaxID=68239 RepID=UPI0021BF16C8|nr:hypothetical protein [Streptomyces mirabilis]MCT9107056.1 hypothetical protein [Streptomyces mirabilis]
MALFDSGFLRREWRNLDNVLPADVLPADVSAADVSAADQEEAIFKLRVVRHASCTR